jgi:hypothetical protein
VAINIISTKFLIAILAMSVILLSCKPDIAEVEPTPTPTPTQPPPAPRNDNVEALNAAQSALDKVEFGFAPLLVEAEAQVQLLGNANGYEIARLVYPQQPEDPRDWPTVDSFISAYAVRRAMLNLPQVSRIALGSFGVSGSVADTAERIDHIAVWVTFTDGSRAVIDLTPLSTNFAARHTPDQMIVDDNEIEGQFQSLRQGVELDQWQPMTVVKEEGELYYLLARVQIFYDRYLFALRIHPVQPADPMEPMSLRPGAVAELEINRTEFEALQKLVTDAGPTAFAQHPELLSRRGSTQQPLQDILDARLELLWHLVSKFEHTLPDPAMATPTPEPTWTPMPTPTPTPTPTPRKLPLVTS